MRTLVTSEHGSVWLIYCEGGCRQGAPEHSNRTGWRKVVHKGREIDLCPKCPAPVVNLHPSGYWCHCCGDEIPRGVEFYEVGVRRVLNDFQQPDSEEADTPHTFCSKRCLRLRLASISAKRPKNPR